jgi:hypothetical protein
MLKYSKDPVFRGATDHSLSLSLYIHTGVSPYLWVIHSKTYHGYMKQWIILNAMFV